MMSGTTIGFSTYASDTMIRSNSDIGRYCSIGRRCSIGAAKHPIDWLTTHPVAFDFIEARIDRPRTKIGNDVWIGDNVVVLEGITIGDGAIIGAGAVVNKDVAPYTIAVGVPAKPIRLRFSEEAVEQLLKIKWWRFGPDIMKGLSLTDINACIEHLRARLSSNEFQVLAPHHRPVSAKSLAHPPRGLSRTLLRLIPKPFRPYGQ